MTAESLSAEQIADIIPRFKQLFQCNERSYGTYVPKVKKALTIKGHPIPDDAWQSHFEGGVGVGGVPILDDGKCWWAAIDIDTHGPNGQNVDLLKIEAKVRHHRLPLLLCRSRSGGAHLYCFFKEPTPAAVVKPQLGRWAATLGFPTAEIFPKQISLDAPLGCDRPLGNWLNLPYFEANGTNRFCIYNGKQVSLEYFLEIAEGSRHVIAVSEDDVDDYKIGPPCLQGMIRNRVDEGGRNNAVYQAAVFLKRAYPEDWKNRVREFNSLALTAPLVDREIRQIVSSVGRKDYQYKCREEPCKSLCDKSLCSQREFGITEGDLKANELPPFERIEKVISTPVRWVIHIQGQKVDLTSEQLFEYRKVRIAVYEALNLLLPPMKNEEWDLHLREVALRAETRVETTIEDVIFQRLCEFLRRAQQDRLIPEEDRRQALARKMPALVSISDMKYRPRGQVDEKGGMITEGVRWYYAFKAEDFIDYLRRQKALIVPEHQVHTILHRTLGEDAKRDKIRAGTRNLRSVWFIDETAVANETVPDKKFTLEY